MKNKIKNRFFSFLLALLSFLLVIFTYNTLNHQEIKSIEQTNRMLALRELVSVRDKIQMTVNLDLQFASFYGFLVSNNPNISDTYIEEISNRILDQNSRIENIGLAPDGIFSAVYPKEENEQLIGYNLMESDTRRPYVLEAINTKSSTTQGPMEAVQGGTLIVNREAIFTEEAGKEKFWGLTTVAVDFDQLIKESGLKESDNGYLFALRSNQTEGEKDFIWGNEKIMEKDSITSFIDLPNERWD